MAIRYGNPWGETIVGTSGTDWTFGHGDQDGDALADIAILVAGTFTLTDSDFVM